MDWGVVGTAFIFGLIASLSCLGLCIPILVPYIMQKDRSLREGLFTSVFFSFGRLIIYFAIGVVVFAIGMVLTEEMPSGWLKIAVVILGGIVVTYGIWILFKLPRPKWCPSKLAANFRPVFSVVLGLLIGSFFCPLLWIALVRAALTREFWTMVFSVVAFWVGSSFAILGAGMVSGEAGGRFGKRIGREKLSDLCGMALLFAGIIYLFNGLFL